MKKFKYIIFILLGLIIIFFTSLSKISAAHVDFTQYTWLLDPYQYSEVYNYNGSNNRPYTSSEWGTYNQGPGFVHKIGAILQNPPLIQNNASQDYFLLPGNIYLLNFNYHSDDVKIRNSQSQLLRDYGDYRSINIKLKYLSTNGGLKTITLTKDNLAYYTVYKFSDYDVKFAFLVTLPNEPDDMNSEFMTMDFWLEPYNCSSLSSGEGCGLAWHDASSASGINVFQMSFANVDIINDYLTTVNSYNSIAFQSETTERIQNVQTFLQNMDGQLADLNELLESMDNPNLSVLRGATSWLPAGPVDSILTMPLSLINSLTSSLSNNTCSPVTLTLPFVNRDITLPCISSIFEQIGVLSFWNWAGVMASAFIVYYYLRSLYKWVDNTLTFRENTQADWGGI